MRTITHREMRNNSAEILRAVAAGETIQVTNNGKVAAILSPPNESVLERLIADGGARPALKPLSSLPLPKRRSKLSTKELIDDLRGDR